MTSHFAPESPFAAPIDQNWTIAELLDRLAQDEQSWESLGPELARIEAAASDLAGRAVWSRTPSTVALVRSLAGLCRTAPGVRGLSVGRLLATELSPRADSVCSASGPRREAPQPQTRIREALALRGR